jgi:hypothetical protein
MEAAADAGTGFFEDRAHMAFALAAAQGNAKLKLQFFERFDAFSNGAPDMAVGHGLAHTDDHAIGTQRQ